jgi:methyltransferase (TIGR00027 family)
MAELKTPINHVTDTALWVAVYRAWETERPDALFKDPLAHKLAGERGRQIESKMSSGKYISWSLVIRTVIIDNYIRQAIADGFDTIVNLGAGLDTRPYRLDLPASLQWIEVDFPDMIAYKTQQLKDEKPRCRLERIAADLSDQAVRGKTLANIAASAKKALVITEGVVIYLKEENVGELADELRGHPQFALWITEWFAPRMRKYIQNPKQMKEMRNAPMQFWPVDWIGFFARHGWEQDQTKFVGEESVRLKREIPMPWWAKIIVKILPMKPEYARLMGYVLWRPKK